MPSIPAGYQVHFQSWEDDGDHCQTEIISGLTRYDALFLVEVADLFWHGGFGADFKKHNDVRAAVTVIFNKHANKISDAVYQQWIGATVPVEDNGYHDGLTEPISLIIGCNAEDYGYSRNSDMYRGIDCITVYRIPQPIEDVSKEFEV